MTPRRRFRRFNLIHPAYFDYAQAMQRCAAEIMPVPIWFCCLVCVPGSEAWSYGRDFPASKWQS